MPKHVRIYSTQKLYTCAVVINSNVWVEGHFSGQFFRQHIGVLVTIHQEHLHIIVYNLLANDGNPFNDPPTQAGALHIIFLKLGQGIINFYQFCAVGKNLKAQCNE